SEAIDSAHRIVLHQRYLINLLLRNQRISTLGHKRAFCGVEPMSALPPKVDIRERGWSAKGQKRTQAPQQRGYYSITSLARLCTDCGTVMPSVLAVFRLSISSTFVVCWTGRSAGLSPLRIFPA